MSVNDTTDERQIHLAVPAAIAAQLEEVRKKMTEARGGWGKTTFTEAVRYVLVEGLGFALDKLTVEAAIRAEVETKRKAP